MQLLRRVNSHYISLEELASLLYPRDELSDYNQKDVEQASILAKRKKQRNKAISLTSGGNTRKIKQKTTKKKKTVCVAQKLT